MNDFILLSVTWREMSYKTNLYRTQLIATIMWYIYINKAIKVFITRLPKQYPAQDLTIIS